MSADTIARLKISLDHVTPTVLRRIEVPFDIRLDRLHLTIQAAMGWSNSHLYEIRVGGVGFGLPDPDWRDGPRDARRARLNDVLEDVGTRTLHYIYDFGDGWDHTIKVERLINPFPGTVYLLLLEAVGRCPPEDIGGPWSYVELLEARSDIKHRRHAECEEWFPDGFDPGAADLNSLSQEVAALAKRWSRTPAAKRTRAS